MSIKSDLRKDGITEIEPLDILTINSIANNISIKLCDTFPTLGLKQNDLFMRLSRVNMYRANMPEGMSEANYFYKNSSIYFNKHIQEEDLEEFAAHECIHFLQEVKDKKNYLVRMGLCDYSNFRVYGLAINEAAVQLMASKINRIPKEGVKYFGINFETNSPSFYPIECCLVQQLAYLVGEDKLFDSTFNSNNNFQNAFVEATSFKTYLAIVNSLDKLLNFEEEIIKLNNKILEIDNRNKKVDDILIRIDNLKHNITLTFMRTQNLIISSYFDNTIKKITNLEECESYRRKLYKFKDYIGNAEGYTFFNTYYLSKMEELEIINTSLENGIVPTYDNLPIIKPKENKITIILKFLQKLLFNKEKEKEYIKK